MKQLMDEMANQQDLDEYVDSTPESEVLPDDDKVWCFSFSISRVTCCPAPISY